MRCIEKHYGREVHFNDFDDLLKYINDKNVKETVKINAKRPKLSEIIGYYVKEDHKGNIYSVHAIPTEGNHYGLWIPAYGTVE